MVARAPRRRWTLRESVGPRAYLFHLQCGHYIRRPRSRGAQPRFVRCRTCAELEPGQDPPALRYERAPGVHTYHPCPRPTGTYTPSGVAVRCGLPARGAICGDCLAEDLTREVTNR